MRQKRCIYWPDCRSKKIYALGQCKRCYKRDKTREYRAKKAKPKPPKPTECIKCGSQEIYVKSKAMCSKCYRHGYRQANLEHAKELEHLSKMSHKARISEYNEEYSHRPQVVERRKVRYTRIRQTPKYKKRMSNYMKKNWRRYIDNYRKAAFKYNRTQKSKLAHARFHQRHKAERNQQSRDWKEKTDYNAKQRELSYYTTRQPWGWAKKQEFLGYQEGEAGEF
jgi:hypothetical protein